MGGRTAIWARVRRANGGGTGGQNGGTNRGANGGANAHMHTRTHIRTHRRTHVRSHVCTYVGTMFRPMFKPMFRPMFRNKVTFEKWPPNTKYALGGLGSYRNKVTFYIKGNLKGNLISEHACERACVHAHERACVHAYVRAYMRMCEPLNAPSRGWARPQNRTGFEYQQLCTSILGLYK